MSGSPFLISSQSSSTVFSIFERKTSDMSSLESLSWISCSILYVTSSGSLEMSLEMMLEMSLDMSLEVSLGMSLEMSLTTTLPQSLSILFP